jgi:sec-independent protein translocase protein TatA
VVGDILQPTHLLFVLVVALLVLGPKRLPEVGRALGRGLRDFRSAMSGEDRSEPAISSVSDSTPVAPAFDQPVHTESPSFAPETHTATDLSTPETATGTETPTATHNGSAGTPTEAHNGSSAHSESEPEQPASEPVTSATGSDSGS